MNYISFKEINVCSAGQEISRILMEPKSLWPYLQEHATFPRRESYLVDTLHPFF
jgi:hypothetical protein